MSILGGFLFGTLFGGLWVIVSATLGATISYLAVKTAFADMLKKKASKNIQKMQRGFNKNEISYLLFLCLLPIFPFFIINIAAGVLDVKQQNFIIGTFFGIIPGSMVYAWVGSGLGYAIAQGQSLNLQIIFSAKILLPIIALALLSLLPILYKRLKHTKEAKL